MKVCFAHGSKFIKDYNGNLYTDGSYSDKIWRRYEKEFGNLTVIGRMEEKLIDKEVGEKKYNFFNNKKYSFIKVENSTKSIISFLNFRLRNRNKKIIEEQIKKTDILIARVPSSISYTAIKYAKKYNKKYICEMVGCPWDALWNHSFRGKILAPFMWYRARRNLKDAPYVMYVTNEFLQKRYPTSGISIGCSDVELKEIDQDVLNKRIIKIKEKKENEKSILGTLGAINVKYKGHEYVIKAIAKLRKEGYNFEYQLVGGGNKKRLEKLAMKLGIKDNVKFLGSKPHEEVFDWLNSIDIYIQPSKTEGLPRALVEAMSRACPCIGSNAGGIPELLQLSAIFQKGKYKSLMTVLRSFEDKQKINEARVNFEKSKEYSKDSLDEKRSRFYLKFLSKEL